MILQALNHYYERKVADSGSAIARPGFQKKEIAFILTLDKNGQLVNIWNTRETVKQKITAREFIVPQERKDKTGKKIAANLLWENPEYALGILTDLKRKNISKEGGGEHEIKTHERRAKDKMLPDFLNRIETLTKFSNDPGLQAIVSFLRQSKEDVKRFPEWNDIKKGGGNVSFKLLHEQMLICERADVVQAIVRSEAANVQNRSPSVCLVTGKRDVIARIHPSIKGIWGSNKKGADIISNNLGAFCSFGKKQSFNAPVGIEATFSYTTALNTLLDSAQRIQLGDASTVFWAERANPMESLLADLFGEPDKDDPDRKTQAVKTLYTAPQSGAAHFEEDGTRFYVLGLAPNASRIAVRFWHVSAVAELARNIRAHFDDISIVHAPHEPEYLSLFRLLVATAPQGESKNIPPNIAGETMKSILSGAPYPQTLLQAVVRRIRAEQSKKSDKGLPMPNVSYSRAGLIKAYLNRQTRKLSLQEKEITVALDETNTNVGYRLGRLFALLEKT